jgi:ribosomal protein L4
MTRLSSKEIKVKKLAETKTLLLIPAVDKSTYLASRNIPLLNVKVVDTVSTYDILNCNMLLPQQSSISKLQGMLTV